jgi:hypothetical protein
MSKGYKIEERDKEEKKKNIISISCGKAARYTD